MQQQPLLTCPDCGSGDFTKDGHRYVKSETGSISLQRYRCKNCTRRFSESSAAPLKVPGSNPGTRASSDVNLSGSCSPAYLKPNAIDYKASRKLNLAIIGATRGKGTRKIMVEVESQQSAMRGATKLSNAEIKGKIVEYSWFMKQEGYRPAAIKSYTSSIEKLVRKGAHLMDPQQVRRVIAGVGTWCDGTKKCMAEAYNVFTRMEHLTWEKPRFKPRSKLPFIPTMQELDQLISGCGRIMRAYLRGLKETAAGPTELFMLEWKDVDFKRRKVSINFPVKNHSARILKVSAEWLTMLSKLPRKSNRIWTAQYDSHYSNFNQRRKRLAHEYGNPRLKQICFRTFRHWKGTMEYHVTKDILHVKEMLGHKTVKSTEVYIHLEQKLFEALESEYEVRRARSIKGMLALAAVGFERFDQVGDVHLYKKPKAAEI